MHTYPVGHVFTIGESKPTYVYALRDAGGEPFYVGITEEPAYRLRQHANCGVSAIRAHLAACCSPEMVILGVHEERRWAIAQERELIETTPGLLNQEQRVKRRGENPRHPVILAMMQRVKWP